MACKALPSLTTHWQTTHRLTSLLVRVQRLNFAGVLLSRSATSWRLATTLVSTYPAHVSAFPIAYRTPAFQIRAERGICTPLLPSPCNGVVTRHLEARAGFNPTSSQGNNAHPFASSLYSTWLDDANAVIEPPCLSKSVPAVE